jgi:hypothetical protein
MTDAERIRALEIDNARLTAEKRALELSNAHLTGEVAGLRTVLDVMRHLLPSALPGTPTVVVPVPMQPTTTGTCVTDPETARRGLS